MGDQVNNKFLTSIVTGVHRLQEAYDHTCSPKYFESDRCTNLLATIEGLNKAASALRQLLSGTGSTVAAPAAQLQIVTEEDPCPPEWRGFDIKIDDCCCKSSGEEFPCLERLGVNGKLYPLGGSEAVRQYEQKCLPGQEGRAKAALLKRWSFPGNN
ncbi:MAG: hypothetical protein HYY43_00640 [Deltaproteobacteria bacterium]|nr:hypothetical protein [Deltaproteobacteria bacterium]MBI2974095.1 hypothetical protein [Deltaproteobacteria bacterium]